MIEDFKFGRIAVLGDLMLDQYISGSVERISPEAPVPVLRRSAYRSVPGGAGNVAMNAAALGASIELVGLIGRDSAGTELLDGLRGCSNIGLSGVVEDQDWRTITKTRVLSGQHQLVRIDDEVIATPNERSIERLVAAACDALSRSEVLVCSDYAKGVLCDSVLEPVIAAARARGIPIIVDPKRTDFSVYRGATLVTPNRGELALASGMRVGDDEGVARAAEAVSVQFGGDVLVTRSEEGMTLWRRDGRIMHVASHRAEVYDVSGAGDTVVAVLASVLSAGQELETAVVIANQAAAISVSKQGTASVSRAELSQALTAGTESEGALVSIDEAERVIMGWRQHGARVVFTNGCFDLLHPGHVSLLRGAAAQGDKLVVAINSDASVKRLKGESRPVQDQSARATIIGALRMVDLVVIFDQDTPLETIMALRPDVLVKGSDYRREQVVGGDFVEQLGGRVALIDLVDGCSTTAIVGRMRDGEAGTSAREAL